MKLLRSLATVCMLTLNLPILWAALEVDEFLERTAYAELINELICLTDCVALLEHPKTDRYDKRFIEDSVLGKLVRAHNYLDQLNIQEVTAHDIAYAQSWIDLAQRSTSQQVLLQEFARFAERLFYFAKNSQGFKPGDELQVE
jgi:hypothetical protein